MKKLLSIAILALATSGAVANRLANPGLENGVEAWNIELTTAVDSSITIVTDAAHSGSRAAKLNFAAGYTPGVYSQLWQTVQVKPSSTYRISFWAKAPEGCGPLAFGGGEKWDFRKYTAPGPFDWTLFSEEYVTGPEEREFTLRFFVDTPLTDLLIDDISMVQVVDPDASAVAAVTRYGAVADGRTDCTAAFAKAFADGNTVVTVPSGNFLVSGVEVPPNCTLTGVGSDSKLSWIAGSPSPWLVKLSDGATVGNLALEAGPEVDGVAAVGVKRVRVERISATKLRNAVIFDHVTDGVIADCHMYELGKAVEIIFSDRIRVCDNDVRDCSTHGIQFWGNYDWKEDARNRDLIITGNIVKNGGAGAIWGTGYDNIVIANNLVDGAEDVGIDLEWCFDAAITGNVVRNAENGGIALFFSSKRVTITGNTVMNNREFETPMGAQFAIRAGIWLTYCNRDSFPGDTGHEDITIVGNNIYNPDTNRRAMFIGSGSKRIRIENNSVNQGELWLGGEHNKPLVMEHFQNGAMYIDENGKPVVTQK